MMVLWRGIPCGRASSRIRADKSMPYRTLGRIGRTGITVSPLGTGTGGPSRPMGRWVWLGRRLWYPTAVLSGALLIVSAAPIPAGAAREAGRAELALINQALRSWLSAVEADVPFVVIDLEARELRLHHGRALLRACAIVADSITVGGEEETGQQELVSKVRRYTRSDPFAQRRPGPFDWEYYLVEAATDDCALYFSAGMLVFASDAWGVPRSPYARLSAADLRAVHDALAVGTSLIVLPPGWRAGRLTGDTPK